MMDKENTLKLDPVVIDDGYYNSKSKGIDLKKMKLNKNYFLQVVYENYIDDNNKIISNKYVSAISTVLIDNLF